MITAHADPCVFDMASVSLTSFKESPNNLGLRSMPLPDLALLKLLSTGGSGKVFLAKDNIGSRHLAVKIIPKSGHSRDISIKAIVEQAVQRALTESKDIRFLHLVASWHDSVNFYLATTYIQGGDMSLELMRCRTFDEERARFYIAEMVITLQHLHYKKIIHRDLKPTNILFDPAGHLVLADFGTARSFCDEDTGRLEIETASECSFDDEVEGPYSQRDSTCLTTEDCGTPLFMAPEQHSRDKYSFEVDYWALAVMLYRMLTGEMPFGQCARSKKDIRQSVLHDPVVFPDNSAVSPEAQDFIQRSLKKDRADRITAIDIPSHPFFDEIDWSSIRLRTAPTPWKPFIRPIPTNSRTTIPVETGEPYSADFDPYPDFTWRSPIQSDSYPPEEERTCKKVIRKCRSLPIRLAFSSTSGIETRTTASLPNPESPSTMDTKLANVSRRTASPTLLGDSSPVLLTPPPPYDERYFSNFPAKVETGGDMPEEDEGTEVGIGSWFKASFLCCLRIKPPDESEQRYP